MDFFEKKDNDDFFLFALKRKIKIGRYIIQVLIMNIQIEIIHYIRYRIPKIERSCDDFI